MKTVIIGIFLWASSAFAAPPLKCEIKSPLSGSIMITSAGSGSVAATGSFIDEENKVVAVSCTGDLISFSQVPGFGENVETFWFHLPSNCPFEFMQLDDSAYKQGAGPMRLTCDRKPCTIRSFVCAK